MLTRDELAQLDMELAALARAEAGLRLRLGEALEGLGRGGHFELGFSSLGAYALERCERSVRWVEAARCLARRLEPLPSLRRALVRGAVSWSMAEVLARVARPEDESAWLEAAQGCTVREMRARIAAATTGAAERASAGEDGAVSEDEECTLLCTLDREEVWLFEATKALLEQLGARGPEEQVEALLAEGPATLLAALPRGSIDADVFKASDLAQRRWSEELARWRAQAEVLCEERIRQSVLADSGRRREDQESSVDGVADAALRCSALEGASSLELDAAVREVSRRLARHELEMAELILRLHRADGWRRLGYATEAQYARERLGMSRSSLLARRSLAVKLERLPRVADALGTALIGVEAALEIVRVATPGTAVMWIARARQRTIKHLREEVAAALLAVRVSGERDCPPPVETEMAAFGELERAVVGGGARECGAKGFQHENPAPASPRDDTSEQRRAWWIMLGSLATWLEEGFQTSAAHVAQRGPVPDAPRRQRTSAGRVELRFSVSRSTRAWWHLRFRSAGGSDEDDNVVAVCTWCHLFGVHGGRIRARGTAAHIEWELGPREHPCLVVHGRERVAA